MYELPGGRIEVVVLLDPEGARLIYRSISILGAIAE